ncbi:hypothetical protein Tco_0009195 [Tanacetum coccineum]
MSDCNPFFKEKGSVRFSALYLKKKRNLLVFTSVDMIVMTSMVELESLFGYLFDELSNGENQVVSQSSAVTTADASDKCQQQQDSTSSTSTLATTITADGNFDLWKSFQSQHQTSSVVGDLRRFYNESNVTDLDARYLERNDGAIYMKIKLVPVGAIRSLSRLRLNQKDSNYLFTLTVLSALRRSGNENG